MPGRLGGAPGWAMNKPEDWLVVRPSWDGDGRLLLFVSTLVPVVEINEKTPVKRRLFVLEMKTGSRGKRQRCCTEVSVISAFRSRFHRESRYAFTVSLNVVANV